MSLFKTFKVTEGSALELRGEAFNIFNHTQFGIFNPNIGNSAENTVSCCGGGASGAPFSAAGGLRPSDLTTGNPNGQPVFVSCASGSSFLHPVQSLNRAQPSQPQTFQFQPQPTQQPQPPAPEIQQNPPQ
jgi:hypothetical protein